MREMDGGPLVFIPIIKQVREMDGLTGPRVNICRGFKVREMDGRGRVLIYVEDLS